MPILTLAFKSILNRRFTALITVFSIALSLMLLLGVERMRVEARTAFANTISGTDLVVGARSGSIQLLLYSVFHIGNATNNISWESYQEISAHPKIAWSVPLALGDSHRGYRVLGTSEAFFDHYHYARDRGLEFTAGKPFADLYDVVLGADVAEQLGYNLEQEIIIAHGAGEVSLVKHDDKPFRVTGILQKSGTPLDRTLLVSLAAIEAIHIDWQGGAPMPGLEISAQRARQMDLTPKSITAFLVGLKSKISTFHVQRHINEYREEPLLAVLPGVALQELWDLMAVAENALLVISGFVVLVGLAGMLTALLTSLNERRREMAILRSLGARPHHVLTLIVGEALFLTLLGVLLGIALLYTGMIAAQPLLESAYGLFLTISPPSLREGMLILTVICAGTLIGFIPGYRAYRNSLADGLTVRL
jgi:putative ABC transport system permease protein